MHLLDFAINLKVAESRIHGSSLLPLPSLFASILDPDPQSHLHLLILYQPETNLAD